MKVGDLVRPATGQNFYNHASVGVIIDTKATSSVHPDYRGKKTNCHQVYWSVPILDVVWVMERDLTKAVN